MIMMNKIELKDKIQRAMSGCQKICDKFRTDDNPQLKEIFNRAAGRIEAYSEVLQALNGNPVFLNISAGE